MVDTAGKKLKQARLHKQLSLEEAARATKIRVPRLVDIENDDYTNFPSMAYVRGFLFIYAKYLGIDVSEYTEALACPVTSVGIGDYEYLSNAPERVQTVSRRPKPKRSLWPLLLIGVLLGMGLCAALVVSFIEKANRLGNLEQLGEKHLSEQTTPATQETSSAKRTEPKRAERPEAPPARNEASNSTPALNLEVRRAETVEPQTQASATPAPAGDTIAASASNEVVVKAVKKTWVKIYKDSPESAPIYEDWLYPDTLPLKLHGTRFYIQMSDRSGLQILKNGISQPIDQPVITIQ